MKALSDMVLSLSALSALESDGRALSGGPSGAEAVQKRRTRPAPGRAERPESSCRRPARPSGE